MNDVLVALQLRIAILTSPVASSFGN